MTHYRSPWMLQGLLYRRRDDLTALAVGRGGGFGRWFAKYWGIILESFFVLLCNDNLHCFVSFFSPWLFTFIPHPAYDPTFGVPAALAWSHVEPWAALEEWLVSGYTINQDIKILAYFIFGPSVLFFWRKKKFCTLELWDAAWNFFFFFFFFFFVILPFCFTNVLGFFFLFNNLPFHPLRWNDVFGPYPKEFGLALKVALKLNADSIPPYKRGFVETSFSALFFEVCFNLTFI